MKKRYIVVKKNLLLAPILLGYFCVQSQTLTKNSVDEFTGTLIKETSWERLIRTTSQGGCMSNFRIRQIDSIILLGVKPYVGAGKYINANEGEIVIFKLSDSTTLQLKAVKVDACEGCGYTSYGSAGWGMHIQYGLSNEDVKILKHKTPTKVRFYLSEQSHGYVEYDLKEKYSKGISVALSLIN